MATVAIQKYPQEAFNAQSLSINNTQRLQEEDYRSILAEHGLSYVLDTKTYDTEGLVAGLPLRAHKNAIAAQQGTDELQADWEQKIGPVKAHGCANPANGHCCVLMFPFCKPERMHLTSYITEFALLYDNVLESVEAAAAADISANFAMEHSKSLSEISKEGVKDIRNKIVAELLAMDRVNAEQVIEGWQQMVSTVAHQDKGKMLKSLEEYVNYRVVDSGAPFLMGLMCWGMGMRLTKEEEAFVAPAVYSAFAVIALANDVVSFDIEMSEFLTDEKETLQNSVWYNLQWYGMSVEESKKDITEKALVWVDDFVRVREGLLAKAGPDATRVQRYLDGLMYMVSGCAVWYQKCPRYDVDAKL